MMTSSFDRVKEHLSSRGSDVAVSAEAQDDLEMVVRRCDEVRGLGAEFGSVELSPYMRSLLRVSRQNAERAAAELAPVAASV